MMSKLSKVLILGIAASYVVGLIFIGTRAKHTYVYTNVKVEQNSEWEFWLTKEDGTRFHITVCPDYDAPKFTTGMILKEVIFVDRSSCWSLDPNIHAGYFILRDGNGQPVRWK